jgi:hypothetical protein
MWSRGDIVFRTLVILLLLEIWGAVSDDTVHEFVRFGLFWVGIGLMVFSVVVLVQAVWDGDQGVDDWLDPGSTRRGRRRR